MRWYANSSRIKRENEIKIFGKLGENRVRTPRSACNQELPFATTYSLEQYNNIDDYSFFRPLT